MKQRVVFWDNFKGILIFLVVFGHFIYSYATDLDTGFVSNLYKLIYTFHMPAFVFCFGYFSKSIRSRGKEALLKLLFCYVIFNTLMIPFSYIFLGSKIKLITPYFSFWYIISLICWRLIIGELEKLKYATILFSFVATLLLGFWSEFSNIFSIRRTIAFFCFFALGYFLDREKMEQFIANRTLKTYILGLGLAGISIPTIYYLINKLDITSSMTLMSSYKEPSEIIIRFILIIIALVMIYTLLLFVPNKEIPLISQFGRNSLLIYLAHRFLTIIFYKNLFTSEGYSNIYILYAFIATLITCIVLGANTLAKHFNNFLGFCSSAMITPEDKNSTTIKLLLLIIFIGCLSLQPLLMLIN